MNAREGFAALALVVGTLVLTVAVLGTLRWRTLALRAHAAANGVVFGVLAILAGALGTGDAALLRRALLVGVFLLLTAPVSNHVILAAQRAREEGAGPASGAERERAPGGGEPPG